MKIATKTQINWYRQPQANTFMVEIPADHVYFSDHRVRGNKVLPGVVYLEIALEAVQRCFPTQSFTALDDCCWIRPIVCDTKQVSLEIALTISGEQVKFDLTRGDTMYSFGYLRAQSGMTKKIAVPLAKKEIVLNRSVRRINREDTYRAFSDMGIDYGHYFRRINYVDIYDNLACSLLSNNDGVAIGLANLLDCSLQSGMAILIGEHQDSLMPFSLGSMKLHRDINFDHLHSYYVLTQKNSPFRTNICICNDAYQPLISIFDLGVKPSQL